MSEEQRIQEALKLLDFLKEKANGRNRVFTVIVGRHGHCTVYDDPKDGNDLEFQAFDSTPNNPPPPPPGGH